MSGVVCNQGLAQMRGLPEPRVPDWATECTMKQRPEGLIGNRNTTASLSGSQRWDIQVEESTEPLDELSPDAKWVLETLSSSPSVSDCCACGLCMRMINRGCRG